MQALQTVADPSNICNSPFTRKFCIIKQYLNFELPGRMKINLIDCVERHRDLERAIPYFPEVLTLLGNYLEDRSLSIHSRYLRNLFWKLKSQHSSNYYQDVMRQWEYSYFIRNLIKKYVSIKLYHPDITAFETLLIEAMMALFMYVLIENRDIVNLFRIMNIVFFDRNIIEGLENTRTEYMNLLFDHYRPQNSVQVALALRSHMSDDLILRHVMPETLPYLDDPNIYEVRQFMSELELVEED